MADPHRSAGLIQLNTGHLESTGRNSKTFKADAQFSSFRKNRFFYFRITAPKGGRWTLTS
jgi:hypothetical protein